MARSPLRSQHSRAERVMPEGDPAQTPTRARKRIGPRALLAIAAALVLAVALAAGVRFAAIGGGSAAEAPAAARFVGSEACAQCHEAEARLWRTSQHKHAMDHASDKTVLGDFANASFDNNGIHSRFF